MRQISIKYFLVPFVLLNLILSCTKSGGSAPSTSDPNEALRPPADSVIFSPDQIPTLHSWFDATESTSLTQSSGQVSRWNDRKNPLVSMQQDTMAYRPLLNLTGLNGKPALEWSGTQQFMSASITVALQASTTVSLVVQLASYNAKIPFSFNNPIYTYGPDLYFLNNQVHWNIGDSGANPFSTSSYPSINTPHIYTIKNNQALNQTELYIDGQFIGTALYRSTEISDLTQPRLYIGNWVSGFYYINGLLGELLIYNKSIDETERLALEGYLKNKWSIP